MLSDEPDGVVAQSPVIPAKKIAAGMQKVMRALQTRVAKDPIHAGVHAVFASIRVYLKAILSRPLPANLRAEVLYRIIEEQLNQHEEEIGVIVYQHLRQHHSKKKADSLFKAYKEGYLPKKVEEMGHAFNLITGALNPNSPFAVRQRTKALLLGSLVVIGIVGLVIEGLRYVSRGGEG